VEEVIPTEEMADRALPRTAGTVSILAAGAVVPVSTSWCLVAMVETQARPARSSEALSPTEMVAAVPETVKPVFRPPGPEEVAYREMVGTVLAPIFCLVVGAEAAQHLRPVSREVRA
jgi:hypothetical protein